MSELLKEPVHQTLQSSEWKKTDITNEDELTTYPKNEERAHSELHHIKNILKKLICSITENDIITFYELEYKISRLKLKSEEHPNIYIMEAKLGQVCDRLISDFVEMMSDFLQGWKMGGTYAGRIDSGVRFFIEQGDEALQSLQASEDLDLKHKILAINKALMWEHFNGLQMPQLIQNWIGLDAESLEELLDDLSSGEFVSKWDKELEKIH